MLSCKAAIKKHLLSHRPETDWPYECPFCFKRFQAKGDLPKHFFTSQHKNDPRIPAPGSLEWHQLLNSCCVIPDWVMPTKRRVIKQTEESYSGLFTLNWTVAKKSTRHLNETRLVKTSAWYSRHPNTEPPSVFGFNLMPVPGI
jgi:hypothetical protein